MQTENVQRSAISHGQNYSPNHSGGNHRARTIDPRTEKTAPAIWPWSLDEGETMALEFVVCLYKENIGDLSGDDLQLGRLYAVVEKDAGHGMMRIIDESGEDYLYPQTWFDSVVLSNAAREQLAKALPRR